MITKFLQKKKIHEEYWLFDDVTQKRVPMEICLLNTLSHPNIVSVIDIFENQHFYQIVMEKHGSGMDLFEFIDRRPAMDEALISYIFRQVKPLDNITLV